jgi:hypothetical protein
VLDGEAARDLGDEAGEPRGLPQLTGAQLLQDETEGVLKEVFGFGPAVGVAVEQDRDAAAVDLDQARLGAPVPRLDPRGQLFGGVDVEVRVQKRFFLPSARPWRRAF